MNKGTHWFHDPATGQKRRFLPGTSPEGWVKGRWPIEDTLHLRDLNERIRRTRQKLAKLEAQRATLMRSADR